MHVRLLGSRHDEHEDRHSRIYSHSQLFDRDSNTKFTRPSILGRSVIKQPLLGGLDTQINASPKDYRVTWPQSRDYDQ